MSAVIALLAIVGTCVVLYPSTASWFSAASEAEALARGGDAVTVAGPEARIRALRDAASYNAALNSRAQVAANQRVPVGTGAKLPLGFDYSSLLRADDYGMMGRIVIPAIGADLPIYHGTSNATLAKGIGHLEGTSLPVGGPGTHSVLAGHRGLASATLFTDLDRVHTGDTFTIYVFGETLTYKVTTIKVVDPNQTKTLDPVPGEDLVTLVTCTPIGINSQRILVTGERVTPTPTAALAGATRAPVGPGFPWWAAGFAVALAAIGVYLWLSGRPVRRDRAAR